MQALDPFSDLSAYELAEALNWKCEICTVGRGTQRHHAIFRRDRRFPMLNCVINYQLVCPCCHMAGAADTRGNRLRHYQAQCDRYGKERVDGWIESLPMIDKTL